MSENKIPYIRHIAGEYADLKQYCIICGYELCNYENAMWPEGQSAPNGFSPGEIFVRKNGGCTSFHATAPQEEIVNCKP